MTPYFNLRLLWFILIPAAKHFVNIWIWFFPKHNTFFPSFYLIISEDDHSYRQFYVLVVVGFFQALIERKREADILSIKIENERHIFLSHGFAKDACLKAVEIILGF
jgi:hypothetical protein